MLRSQSVHRGGSADQETSHSLVMQAYAKQCQLAKEREENYFQNESTIPKITTIFV